MSTTVSILLGRKKMDQKTQKAFSELAKSYSSNWLVQPQLSAAIESLKRILQKDGVLYLSWRVTEGEDARHADGRSPARLDFGLNSSKKTSKSR